LLMILSMMFVSPAAAARWRAVEPSCKRRGKRASRTE
jgi:hypothetical protein